MTDPAAQPSNRTKRSPLFILVLAAVIGAGLWYWQTRTDTQRPPEPVSETIGGTSLAADDAKVAGAIDDADTGTTDDSGTGTPVDDIRLSDADTATLADAAPTTGAGTTMQTDEVETGGSDATGRTDVVRTTDSSVAVVSEPPRTIDTEAVSDARQAADAGRSEAETRTAATEPAAAGAATAGAGEAPLLAPAPGGTIELAPLDAPPVAETTGETGILVAADRAIEHLETVVEERLGTGPGTASDTELRVQVTYGDSQVDAAQVTAEPNEAARTTDPDTGPLAGAGQTTDSANGSLAGAGRRTDSGAAPPAGDLQTAAAPAAAGAGEDLLLAPAPEGSIEQVPLDAPPVADTIGETGILAALDRAIERLETVVKEQIDTALSAASDTKLRVQVTYDDSQEDATQVAAEPKETARAIGSGAGPLADTGRSADSDTGSLADADRSADSGTGPLAGAGPTPDAGATLPAGDAQTADSDIGASEDITRSPDSGDATPPEDTRIAAATEAEAREYVEHLTDAAPPTIPVDRADHFVTQDHVVSLVPEDTIETLSVEDLARDETLGADTPITIVREVEQTETAIAEQLIAESGGDLDTKLRVVVRYDDTADTTEAQNITDHKAGEQKITARDDFETSDAERNVAARDRAEPEGAGQTVVRRDTVEQTTVREVLERLRTEPETPITLVKKVRFFEVMTLRELLETGVDSDMFLNVVRQPYRLEAATLADLLQRKQAENPDTIFYLHTVLPTDEQGIWGIVHFGLIDNFARGVAVRRGEEIETYTVQIPRDADERLEDRSSSFLGKLIDRKTKDSYVYNYRDNRMGRNPDRIYPGQELVIINFEPEELIAIFRHFAVS